MFTQIRYEVSARIATITLDRPDRLNAWTLVMQAEVRRAFDQAGSDGDVRAIVLTGAGRGFCAGADLGSMGKVLDGTVTAADLPSVGTDKRTEASFDQVLSYPLRTPKPVIAAINGPAVGIGLCLALFCDVRFMSASARLSTAFARLGLIAEYGSAWMLSRLAGPMTAFDLLYSARQVDAEEAGRLGLARIVPDEGFMQAVYAYATELVTRSSPRSLAIIKRQITNAFHQSLAESCVESDAELLESLRSEDVREGIAHFLGKRAPDFTGR